MTALLSEKGELLVCRHCGQVEPHTWSLDNNHGNRPDDCTARRLIRHQLTHAVRNDRDLDIDVVRARRVGLDPDAIIERALAELPSLCVTCKHNPKTHGDYCVSHREKS